MPIINVDEGITKKQIKIMAISGLILLSIGTVYIFRTQIEKNIADTLWEKQKLSGVAIKLYSWAAQNGNLHSQSQLAHILRGSLTNYNENISASTWLKMAAEQGDPRSMYYYGSDIIEGKTGGTPVEQGIEYVNRAINSGYSLTEFSNFNYVLANGYLKSSENVQKGIYRADDKNLEKAREYAEKSFLNKDINSINLLLSIYQMVQPNGFSEEVWINKIIDLQMKNKNSNGAIANNYFKLYKITGNQTYNEKYSLYVAKALADPLDPLNKSFLQPKIESPKLGVSQSGLEEGDDPNATEGTLLAMINSLKALQARGSHQNGMISKTYYRLYRNTHKEEYKVKMIEYGNLAIKDPDDQNSLYVKKWVLN